MNKAFGNIPNKESSQNSDMGSAYYNDDRMDALMQANQSLVSRATADIFGGDPIVPPSEFGGGLYNQGGHGDYGGYGTSVIGDIGSWPGRYGGGYGGYGYMGSEGWVYKRTGQTLDHLRIAQCRIMYKTEGVVQMVVHLLADFVTEGLKVEHKDESVSNFYKAWAKKIALQDRMHRFVVDLLVNGNLFVWRKSAKLKKSEKISMKRGNAYAIGGELYDEEHHTIGDLTRDVPAGTEIPWGYISLNALQMESRGSRFVDEDYWVMKLTAQDVKEIKQDGRKGKYGYSLFDDVGGTEINIPQKFKGSLTKVKGGANKGVYSHELKLDKKQLTVIHDITKADYEVWATPQIYPAYKEIMFKRLMRAGEISAVESLKNTITLLKLGDVKEGLAPTGDQIKRVAAAIAAGSQSHYLIWDDLIEGQVLEPNIGRILDPKKYEQIDKDIFTALGVSETVLTGQGSYANSFLSIKLLLEKLETIRTKLTHWLLFELKIIAERMKFRSLPQVRFGLMNLRDENAERKLITDLFDRGILSKETILEFYDLNYDHERTRQLGEKRDMERDNNPEEGEQDVFGVPKTPVDAPVMVPTGPFRKGGKPPAPKGLNEPKPFSGKNGRPGNDGKEQEKKRDTKPQGMAQIFKYDQARSFVTELFPRVQKCVTEDSIALHGVPDVRSLNKEAKAALDHLIIRIVAEIPPGQEITDNLVYNTLGIIRSAKATTSTNTVYKSFCEVADTFKTKAAAREGFCSMYAAYHAGIGVDNDYSSENTEHPQEG